MRALGRRWGRPALGLLGALAVVLALVAAAPLGTTAPTLGELYRTTSPSVVVIRAKGNQVTSSGVVAMARSARACSSRGTGAS